MPVLVLTLCALLALLLLRGSLADRDTRALEELLEPSRGATEPEVPEGAAGEVAGLPAPEDSGEAAPSEEVEAPEVPEGAAGEVAGLPAPEDSEEPEEPDTPEGALPRAPERE